MGISKLSADELAAVKVPITNVLTALATGDGSKESIVGQAIVLQGLLVSLAPQIQKIGVNDLAASALDWLDKLATAPAAQTTVSSPEVPIDVVVDSMPEQPPTAPVALTPLEKARARLTGMVNKA